MKSWVSYVVKQVIEVEYSWLFYSPHQFICLNQHKYKPTKSIAFAKLLFKFAMGNYILY
jgi:hypothetical protein